MAFLKIFRPRINFGTWRRLIVYVDGERIGSVGFGEMSSFFVSAGRHVVYVRMDWCYSPEKIIYVPADGEVKLKCGLPNVGLNDKDAFILIIRSLIEFANFFRLYEM